MSCIRTLLFLTKLLYIQSSTFLFLGESYEICASVGFCCHIYPRQIAAWECQDPISYPGFRGGIPGKQVTVNIKTSSLQHGDWTSIVFDGREYCANKYGVNIVIFDFLTFKVTKAMYYDTGHDPMAASKLVDGIASIPDYALVFLAFRGEANFFMTDEAIEALKELGVEEFNFKTGELWAYIGQKKKDGQGDQIAIHRNYDQVLLQTGISLGRFVNQLVQVNILFPVIELMMSTLPSSPISKVSDLELLTIMARHNDHKYEMVGIDGFLDYMAELIWNVASKTPEYLRETPLVVAHCIGALKIVCGISITEDSHDHLLRCFVLNAVLTLLYFVNGISLNRVNRQVDEKSPQLSPKRRTSTVDEDQEEEYIDIPLKPVWKTSVLINEEKTKPEALDDVTTSTSPLPSSDNSISHDGRKTSAGPSEDSFVPEDFEDAFSSIVRMAVTVMYNCMGLFATAEGSRESLIKSGSLHTLWCTLLTNNESTLGQIGLPVEALLNSFGCMGITEKSLAENVMELDERIKTPALVLSADRLEAYNINWTFESIRATFCVGHGMYPSSPHPSGWYFEVTLKSSGILQIGWQTDECRYGPEKGVGVGDDQHSCAFDGARCKIWSGPPSEQHNNDYGTEWQDGDVLSCLFSWQGDVSFWLNGADQGVAFRNLTTNVNWYPAVSLAMDQHCVFNFGNKPFSHEMPDGYVPVTHVMNFPKKVPMRLSSCWTSLSGSFESIVEEEEEEDSSLRGSRNGLSCPKLSPLPSPTESSWSEPEERDPVIELDEKPAIFCSDNCPNTPDNELSRTSGSLTPISPSSQMLDTPDIQVHAIEDVIVDIGDAPLNERTTLSRGDADGLLDPDAQSEFRPKCQAVFSTPVPWVPFSPGESLCGDSGTPSFPCLYFEAELKCSRSKVKQIGFFNYQTEKKLYCDLHDGVLYLPKTSVHCPSNQECYKIPDTVGCGILWPAGVVIFTLDGVGTGHYYTFPSSEPLNIQNLLPYVSCSRIRCNYGQRPFLFEDANFKQVFYAGANVLHAHGLSEEVSFVSSYDQ